MAISKEDAIKELQNRDMVYVAYSQFTKLPYVKCDEVLSFLLHSYQLPM